MSTQISTCKFKVLVVDDDVTSLNVISSMLRILQYEVFAVNCPLDALPITRFQKIDIVLSDLHMPKMDGLQLQKQIEAESKLPVIIMSSDDNEKIMLKSLTSGAVFFISKPMKPENLKNLWQYAIASKRDKSMKYIEKIGSIQAAGSLLTGKTSYHDEYNSGLSVNKEKHKGNKKESKRKSYNKDKEKVEGEKTSVAPKKAKVVWDNTLHNRFMQAIRHITLEKAVPKQILAFMNVPGLTRENVASHLQKYRIFLKKVAEKGFGATPKNSMTLEKTFQSSFAAGHYPMMYQNSQEAYSPFKGLEKQTSPLQSFNPNKFGLLSGRSSSNSEFASLSSSSPYGFGQSRLLGGNIQANVHKPLLGNTNSLIRPNCTGVFGLGTKDIGTNMSSGGGAMPVSGSTNSMPISNNLNNNMSTPSCGTSRIWNPSSIAVGKYNMESTKAKNVSLSDPNLNLNYFNNNNCVGIQIINDENPIALGGDQVRLNSIDGLNGATEFGLINNEAPTLGLAGKAVGDLTSGTCLPQSKSSSARFNHEKYQSPTSFPSVNIEQVSTSAPPSLAQQQSGLSNSELNDLVSDLMSDNNDGTSCFSEPQQLDKFADKLMESTKFQLSYHQLQGGEAMQNLNFASGLSIPSETIPPVSQPLDDFHFPSSCNVEDSHRWDEPSLEQLLEIELLNPDLEDNIANPSNDYHPVLDNNSSKQQGDDDVISSKLSDEFVTGNTTGWDDDFMDSLLGDRLF